MSYIVVKLEDITSVEEDLNSAKELALRLSTERKEYFGVFKPLFLSKFKTTVKMSKFTEEDIKRNEPATEEEEIPLDAKCKYDGKIAVTRDPNTNEFWCADCAVSLRN